MLKLIGRIEATITRLGRWQLVLGRVPLAPPDLALAIGLALTLRWLSIFQWGSPNIDVIIYWGDAFRFWHLPPLFHALPLEYPPWALAPFSLTLFPPIADPIRLFTAWMAVLFVGGYLLIFWRANRQASLLYLLYMPLGAAAFIVARFDIAPMLATLGAFFALRDRRFALGSGLLVMGGLIKLYPFFLMPLAVAACWGAAALPWPRRLARSSLALTPAVLVLAAGIWLPWHLNPDHAWNALTYAAQRPTQVESTWSLIVWASTGLGHPTTIDFFYGSHNWLGPLSMTLATWSTPVLVVGCLAIALAHLAGRLDLLRAYLATLSIILLANKVFSTQYLIWVLPFVAIVEGFDLVWVGICLLTSVGTVIYPFNTPFTPEQVNGFMVVMLGRNGLMIFAFARLLWRRAAPVPAGAAMAMAIAPTELGGEQGRGRSVAPTELSEAVGYEREL